MDSVSIHLFNALTEKKYTAAYAPLLNVKNIRIVLIISVDHFADV